MWQHTYNGSYKASKMDPSPIINRYVYEYHAEILVKSMVKSTENSRISKSVHNFFEVSDLMIKK